ncbi:MAG: signal recognition particle protein [Bacillota bacterium]
MIFENLASRIQETFKKLRGRGKLTEADVDAALREVRLALLEADVNYRVVKEFIGRVRERALGQAVLESLTPAQQVIKIVNDELTSLMGGQVARLSTASQPPSVYLMVGLQGAGKTTVSGKLALMLKKGGRRPLLVAADIYRPAAIDQLETLGRQIDVRVFSRPEKDAVLIAREGAAHARREAHDVVIIDTAGRLQMDEKLMHELEQIKAAVRIQETLLVVDAMTGQEAVNVAQTFNERIGIDGIILTKLDGDARGGAALSAKAVTGKAIKFAATGEKLDAFEPFHPDRMAARILGMGDMLSLIEKAQAAYDEKTALELEKKLRKAEFTFDDFLAQLQQVRNMGPLDQILGMLPGMGNLKKLQGMQVDEKELSHIEAIIRSMTREERRKPEIIDGSRRKRIARGSGTSVQEVNRLLKQFYETKKLFKKLSGLEKGLRKGAKLPFMR